MVLGQSRSEWSELPKYGAKSLFCFHHVFFVSYVNFKE